MRRLLREPALHFVLLGAGLFALHRVVATRPRGETVVVPASVVASLRADAVRRTGRPATPAELHAAIDRWVDDDVLFREALARGMERADPMVHRRLVQSMAFELQRTATVPEPTDPELAQWLAAHPAQYATPGAVSIVHVFLERRRHGETLADDARTVRARLEAGGDPATAGDPWVAPAVLDRQSPMALRPLLGEDLTDRAESMPVGAWSDPLESPLGMHLLRVTARDPPTLPPLAAVRDRVRSDLMAERHAAADARAVHALRTHYRVRIEGD